MRLTIVLHRTGSKHGHNFYRFFKDQVKQRKTLRKIIDAGIPDSLKKRGIMVQDALDFVSEKDTETIVFPDPYNIPPEKRTDSGNPNWHDRPAYIMRSDIPLLEGNRHMCVLTKTVCKEGLPQIIYDQVQKLSSQQDDQVKAAILQSVVWDCTQEKLPYKKHPTKPIRKLPGDFGIPNARQMENLMNYLPLLCDRMIAYFPNALDLAIIRDVSSQACVHRDENLIVFNSHVHSLVSSKNLLAPVASQEEVQATTEEIVPDLFPAKYTLELDYKNIYTMDEVFPIHQNSLRPFVHTLQVGHCLDIPWKPSQQLATAMLACFTFAAAQARRLYGVDVLTPHEPVTLQCIYGDVKSFGFLMYQLNTLDFRTEDGIKNQAWVEGPYSLYEDCSRQTGLVGYNPQVYDLMLAFYKNSLISTLK